MRIPPTGARLVIASDGLWDSMPAGRVARLLRQQPTAKGAALAAVSAAATARNGLLADDVTGARTPGCGSGSHAALLTAPHCSM